MTPFNRREFLKRSGAGLALYGMAGLAGGCVKPAAHVVVVGGGFGGATAAKYIRLWSAGHIDVTLIDRNPSFISCPLSNLVLGGVKTMDDITVGYGGLRGHGVRVLQGEVAGIDADRRVLRLANGESMSYDRLLLSPGIDFLYDSVPGLDQAAAESGTIPHAWKAGAQTVILRQQLEAMRDGGVYALCIPKAPYRCPPGPYERACMVAHYLKTHKPKSKVLILDANEDVTSKKGLFTKVWSSQYAGMIEYRKEHAITALDIASKTVRFDFGDPVKADVLNVVPAQAAANIAQPFINKNKRWVGVDWLSMETEVAKHIHVIGDATFSAPAMPKSGHMANQHAKVAAAAIVNLLSGQDVNPAPMVTNTCYSFVDDKNVVHVASVHAYNAKEKTFMTVDGSGGLSPAPSEVEGKFALSWAKNIWADTLD